MFKDLLKRWNRRRLEKRRLKQSGQQLQPIDPASLSTALGAHVQNINVRDLLIATSSGPTTSDSASAQPLHAWRALLGAIDELPTGIAVTLAVVGTPPADQCGRIIQTLPLPKDAPPLLAALHAAKAQGASHLLWVNHGCIVEPHAFAHLLRVSEAAQHNALVDALHFPHEAAKSFDPNSLTTPWISSECLLVPSAGFDLLDQASSTTESPAALDMALSRKAQAEGLALISCPTALVCAPPKPVRHDSDDGHTVSVIIRHHDFGKFAELRRCLFSIACSTWPHIEAIVVCQSFPTSELAKVERHADLLHRSLGLRIKILNPDLPKGIDHRSTLLNTGIEAANGRYLAFLDYDDCIYPTAYDNLIQACRSSGSHIAFGDIYIKRAAIVGDTTIVRSHSRAWGTRNLFDLLHDNCCPIHSYVVDRQGVPEGLLRFDKTLNKYEDYDFLIKICSQYKSDFSQISEVVGDYYIKEDGSNSVITASSFSSEAKQAWQTSKQVVHDRRDQTPLSPQVLDHANKALQSAGLPQLASGATVLHLNQRSTPLRQLN
ncbi:MAG: glycosyltransferase family 2 protein [Aquabacterium sp.]|uniref:glycosyltransferase family 2 protein n=1 Tax=Aquabacterium sp. TaxID=1872578 RepID=UPI00120E5465|nr:glycosyltransferase family A protein [Aquabacterium sp.]TAK91308.1 MAG: glycosyltransferase family 2 protein [Aquabacterium sp.]